MKTKRETFKICDKRGNVLIIYKIEKYYLFFDFNDSPSAYWRLVYPKKVDREYSSINQFTEARFIHDNLIMYLKKSRGVDPWWIQKIGSWGKKK